MKVEKQINTRLFFIPLNIDDYNIELPRIIVLSRPNSFDKSPHTNGLGLGFLPLLSF